MGLSMFDEFFPAGGGLPMVAATGTTGQSFIAAGSYQTRVDQLTMINTDTIDHVIELSQLGGAFTHVLGLFNIPSSPLLGPALPVDVMALLDPTPNHGVVLIPGQTINIRPVVAIVTGAVSADWRGGLL
jgi:hypothetical protein